MARRPPGNGGGGTQWSVRAGDRRREDVLWGDATPLPGSRRIAGKVACYDERVDVTVDGVRQERPRSPFA